MSKSIEKKWLVVAGVVSGYTWDLFRLIASKHNIRLRVVHRSLAGSQKAAFAHESFDPGQIEAYDWFSCGRRGLLNFMRVDEADFVLALGVPDLISLALCLANCPKITPVVFAGDTNIRAILPATLRDWARIGGYRVLARYLREGWTLGRTNEEAFRLLGIARTRQLPFYAINYDEFGTQRPNRGATDEVVRLLAVARLVPEKNLVNLCRAVLDRHVHGRFKLTIIGDGPERKKIETIAVSGADMSLVGARPRSMLGEYYSAADALVLPSLKEPWGNVVVEALGLGVPVIATPEVGAAVSLAGRFHGILVSEGGSVKDLVAVLRQFLRQQDILLRAATLEAKDVRAEFDIQSVAARMVETARLLEIECNG